VTLHCTIHNSGAMFHLGEIAVWILASLLLVEGRDYEVLRNNSGHCYLHCLFFSFSFSQIYDHDIVNFKAFRYIYFYYSK